MLVPARPGTVELCRPAVRSQHTQVDCAIGMQRKRENVAWVEGLGKTSNLGGRRDCPFAGMNAKAATVAVAVATIRKEALREWVMVRVCVVK